MCNKIMQALLDSLIPPTCPNDRPDIANAHLHPLLQYLYSRGRGNGYVSFKITSCAFKLYVSVVNA